MLLDTAVIVVLGVQFNSGMGDIGNRLTDTNSRFDAMQQNMMILIQTESAKLQVGMKRVEGVLDVRLLPLEN